jgi:hypothetical protein
MRHFYLGSTRRLGVLAVVVLILPLQGCALAQLFWMWTKEAPPRVETNYVFNGVYQTLKPIFLVNWSEGFTRNLARRFTRRGRRR